MANQNQTHNGPTNVQTIEVIKHPTQISPTRSPVLTQQITADFQKSQDAWNKLSNHMNEMTKINELLKKAVKGTYKN